MKNTKTCRVVLAIDPGRSKCGVAVVEASGTIRHREIAPSETVLEKVTALCAEFAPDIILVGDATTGQATARAITRQLPAFPVQLTPEKRTSEEARRRYFAHCPPTGLRRFLPTSLQTPPCPIDDWAAVILAERYFEGDRPL